MIQTVKRTLLVIVGSQKLTLDFFTTIVAETELTLNSRPLTHVADQPENKEPLTPNHFLLHRPFANLPLFLTALTRHFRLYHGKKFRK